MVGRHPLVLVPVNGGATDTHCLRGPKFCTLAGKQSGASHSYSGVPRNFVRGGSTNSVEDRGQRERGSGGGSPLVRGSGGSCNLVQEI